MPDYKATVFIPTWFGERYLDEVLDAVFKQKVPFKYEVLIYDTSSKDRTPEIIEKYAKKHKNLRHKTITKDEFGHGKTRNAAAHDAKGEIVVYISQDVTPAHNRWLYEMIKPFELSEKIVGVMGKQDPRPHCFPLLKSEIRSTFRNFGPDFGTTLFIKMILCKIRATMMRYHSILTLIRLLEKVFLLARYHIRMCRMPKTNYSVEMLLTQDTSKSMHLVVMLFILTI